MRPSRQLHSGTLLTADAGLEHLPVGVVGFIPGITVNLLNDVVCFHEFRRLLLGLFQISILHNIDICCSRSPAARYVSGIVTGCGAPKGLPRGGSAAPHWVHKLRQVIQCAGRRYAGNGVPRTVQDPRRGKRYSCVGAPQRRNCPGEAGRHLWSDLHLYHGMMPDTRVGMTFGHEFIGVVHEVGPSVQSLKPGDRVMVPFNIYCGSCYFCVRGLYANCHNVNPNATAVGAIWVFTHLRWLRRWAGRVRAGALRRRWAQFDSGVDG